MAWRVRRPLRETLSQSAGGAWLVRRYVVEVEGEARSLRLRPGSLRALEGSRAGGRDQGVVGGGSGRGEVERLYNLGQMHDEQGRPEEARLLRDLL